MFGKHKKLYREGAQTEGVIIKATAVQDPKSVDPGYEVVVRAKFPDGSTTEFTQGRLLGCMFPDTTGTPYVGQVVPVRYDESDHSNVVVDIPALEARHKQATMTQQAQLDAQVAHLGAPGAQTAGGPAAQLLAPAAQLLAPAAQLLAGLSAGGDLKAQLLQMAAQNPGSVIDLRSSQPPAERSSDRLSVSPSSLT
jgi:hypothetical protein